MFALHRDRRDVYISYFFVLVNTIKFDEYILVTFVVQRGFERSTNFFLQVKRISFFFVAARQWLVNKSSCSSLLALKGSLWRDDLEVHLKYRGQLRLYSINPPKQSSRPVQVSVSRYKIQYLDTRYCILYLYLDTFFGEYLKSICI